MSIYFHITSVITNLKLRSKRSDGRRDGEPDVRRRSEAHGSSGLPQCYIFGTDNHDYSIIHAMEFIG